MTQSIQSENFRSFELLIIVFLCASFQSHISIAQTIAGWTTGTYHESNLTYDLNGNIKTLTRNGQNGSLIDELTYTYNGNQLLTVTDAGDKAKGFIDGSNTDDDFLYDALGNLISDKNKDITSIEYNELNLPEKVTKSNGDYVRYTYDANGQKLCKQLFTVNNLLIRKTDYIGDFYYENDTLKFIDYAEGRVMMNNGSPEYQYFLKDHLGNTRVTFTTQPGNNSSAATYETANVNADQSNFQRYDDAKRINASLFNHTTGGSYSQRLNGSANEKYGLARSISVMAGDTIKMEVYEKYVDTNSSNWTAALTTLMGQIANNATGVVFDGANYPTNGNQPFVYAGLDGSSNSPGTGPKAYLNWLIFDTNYVFINGGYVQMTNTPKENGSNVPFEKLSASIVANQPGYVYVYLSNENPTPIDVYWDDFTVTLVKSPIVSQQDYYPFGYSFNSYQRENSLPQNYLYNGKELQHELGLDLYDYGTRMYDPTSGRFLSIDPLAEKYNHQSVFVYAANDPVVFVDALGMEPVILAMGEKTKPVNAVDPFELINRKEATAVNYVHDQTGVSKRQIRASWNPDDLRIHVTVFAKDQKEAKNVTSSFSADNDLDIRLTVQVGSPPNDSKLEDDEVEEAAAGAVFHKATRVPEGLKIGKKISPKAAQEQFSKGKDIYTNHKSDAKDLVNKAKSKKTKGGPVHDEPHGQDKYPHFHDKERKGGHSFYGKPKE